MPLPVLASSPTHSLEMLCSAPIATVAYENRAQLRGLLDADRPVKLTGFGHGSQCLQWNLPYLARETGAQTHAVTVSSPGSAFSSHRMMTLSQFHEACVARTADSPTMYIAGPNLLEHGHERLYRDVTDVFGPAISSETSSAGPAAGADAPSFSAMPVNTLGLWCGQGEQLTPLHFDCAHNILLQIRGTKTFRLAHPDHFGNLYTYTFKTAAGRDDSGEIYRFSEVDCWNPDFKAFPRASRVPFLDVTLAAGEAILVPLGWFHSVRSDADPIDGFHVAFNIFWDASEEDWARRKHLKSFRQHYAPAP